VYKRQLHVTLKFIGEKADGDAEQIKQALAAIDADSVSYTHLIKIAEGCDHPCTFCIIPQLRGKFRSRRFESVIAEAERLAQVGVREITLIGQDTTCYGEDFGLKDGLALLLEKLAKIDDLRWIRFLYAYRCV